MVYKACLLFRFTSNKKSKDSGQRIVLTKVSSAQLSSGVTANMDYTPPDRSRLSDVDMAPPPPHYEQHPEKKEAPVGTAFIPSSFLETDHVYLPEDAFFHILTFLGYKDICHCKTVSKSWQHVAFTESLWAEICSNHWAQKVYVKETFKQLYDNGECKRAFREALEDSTRAWVTREELIKFDWDFRFKKSAGEHWTANDPYWNDLEPTKIIFYDDNTLVFNVPQTRSDTEENEHLRGMEFQWQFVQSSGGRVGPEGSFVRVNHFPSYIVSRHPNWGFTMESCWVLLTSFPMPAKGSDKSVEDRNLPVGMDQQLVEVLAYNYGIPLDLINVAMQDHNHAMHDHNHGPLYMTGDSGSEQESEGDEPTDVLMELVLEEDSSDNADEQDDNHI